MNDIDLQTGNTGNKGANIKEPNYIILAVSVINTVGSVDYTFWADVLNSLGAGHSGHAAK